MLFATVSIMQALIFSIKIVIWTIMGVYYSTVLLLNNVRDEIELFTMASGGGCGRGSFLFGVDYWQERGGNSQRQEEELLLVVIFVLFVVVVLLIQAS